MTKCIGLIGKIFGHKYEKFLTSSASQNIKFEFIYQIDGAQCADALKDKYIVICKRCGAKCDE